ncbi:MAG TPA: DNA replication/repair protein RecF [Clostridiaceae bacterium]|nr:DNA replication/repair protein RecF [Clostridiaceae bacterium]
MKIRYLNLMNYRNYEELNIELNDGVNVFQGENAQGKTNILEAMYYCAFGRSHRTTKDKELVRWDMENARIRLYVEKERLDKLIEVNLLKDGRKSIGINKIKIKKIGDLLGTLNVVMFSPEDLKIVKESPVLRRRFLDMEISQLDKKYYNSLIIYNKVLNERNTLLKGRRPDHHIMDVYDEQLADSGVYLIRQRLNYISMLNAEGKGIHKEITSEKEDIEFVYRPNVEICDDLRERYLEAMKTNRAKDVERGNTSVGVHRDDFTIHINGIDTKSYGSQGQQRTAVLTMKFSSLEIIKNIKGEYPVLLLDDVLSELDLSRKKFILKSIENIQTVITCTGVENIEDYLTGNYRLFNVRDGALLEGEE